MQESMDLIMGRHEPQVGGSSGPENLQQQQPQHGGDASGAGSIRDPAAWVQVAAMPGALPKVWKATGDGTDITLDYNTGSITLRRVAGGAPAGSWSKQGLDGSAVRCPH